MSVPPRQVRLAPGRVVVSGPALPSVVKVPPPGRGVASSQAPAHSEAALHGQGLGLGLGIIVGGASGGQQGGGGHVGPPTYQASTNTLRPGGNVGSLAVNLPTYAAGNMVVINLCGDFLLATDTATAAGWTQDGVVANGQRILFAFHRLMTGNEGTTVTFTFNNSFERPFAVAATYSGASSVEVSTATHLDTPSSTWSCGPVTTTGANELAIAFGLAVNSNFTTVAGGATKRIDVTSLGGGSQTAGAMIADLGAATAGPYTMSGATAAPTTIHSIVIALKP